MSINLTDYAELIFSDDSLATVEQKKWVANQLAVFAPSFYTEALQQDGEVLGKNFLSVETLLETFLAEKVAILSKILTTSKETKFTQFVELYYLKLKMQQLDVCIAMLQGISE